MSDTVLRFIPTDPAWRPSSDQADDAAALLRTIVAGVAEVRTLFPNEIAFFDPGQNWSGVECPNCDADGEGWFWDALDTAAREGFRDLSVTAPCCGAQTSLNALRYKWPAGFGRFALEVLNPGIADTTSEQENALARCIGSALKKIWVRI